MNIPCLVMGIVLYISGSLIGIYCVEIPIPYNIIGSILGIITSLVGILFLITALHKGEEI